ncbi:MAG: DUF4405 domain-containing protein [Pontiellaceae bacterium]|nr:DUF4405 domain-containing protein [Pontiellaceae bacterium]MBN2785482.1 DUF4405 domain-containing protein [Pontiellaceae bacterium]
MSLRKITSLTLLLSFILVLLTSIIAFVAPTGRHSGQWELWNLSKDDWLAIHTNLGFLLLSSGIIHIFLNIKPIVNYLKNRKKQLRIFTMDFNLSLVITVIFVAGTLLSLPPISLFQKYRESRKGVMSETNTGSHQSREAEPVQVVLPVEQTLVKPMPEEPRRLGRQTIGSLCEEYRLDTETIISGLAGFGIKVAAGDAMRDAGEANNIDAKELYALIRDIAAQNR